MLETALDHRRNFDLSLQRVPLVRAVQGLLAETREKLGIAPITSLLSLKPIDAFAGDSGAIDVRAIGPEGRDATVLIHSLSDSSVKISTEAVMSLNIVRDATRIPEMLESLQASAARFELVFLHSCVSDFASERILFTVPLPWKRGEGDLPAGFESFLNSITYECSRVDPKQMAFANAAAFNRTVVESAAGDWLLDFEQIIQKLRVAVPHADIKSYEERSRDQQLAAEKYLEEIHRRG